jgi:ornithine carbamoyltransferase
MTLRGRDVLRVTDLDAAELAAVLDLAARCRADRSHLRGHAAGRTVALLFEKPSLRTKSSFAVGAARLGLLPFFFGSEEVGLGQRESIKDVARMLSCYFDLVVCRTFGQQRIAELAEHCSVPVINALTDLEHPCQALADLLTLRERFGDLRGLRMAWIGDGNNVCHSVLLAAAQGGMDVAVATPRGREPQAAIVAEARALGARIDLTAEPSRAAAAAHAVYTDTWVSMGKEGETATVRETFAGFTVDTALMGRARPDAVFMHCLPAHRGEEVTSEVLDGPASVVLQQAENRLHVQVALMALLLDSQPEGRGSRG